MKKGYVDNATIFSITIMLSIFGFVLLMFFLLSPKEKELKNKDVQNALNLCTNGVASMDLDEYGGPSVHCK